MVSEVGQLIREKNVSPLHATLARKFSLLFDLV